MSRGIKGKTFQSRKRGFDQEEEGDRGRSVKTDSGKIANMDFFVVLPSTYFMIQILQCVMNNKVN